MPKSVPPVERPFAPTEIAARLHSQPVAQADEARAADQPVPAEAAPPSEQAIDATHSEILLDREAMAPAAETPSEPESAAMPRAEVAFDPAAPDLDRPGVLSSACGEIRKRDENHAA